MVEVCSQSTIVTKDKEGRKIKHPPGTIVELSEADAADGLKSGVLLDATDTNLAKIRGARTPGRGQVVDTSDVDGVVAAIRQLDEDDESLWSADGAPKVTALSAALGRRVTSDERDEAWARVQAEDDE